MALAEATIPEWTFGERLAKARKHAGMNQAQMAKRLHVSASAVAKWESDRGEPRSFRETIDAWAEVTGVDPAWLRTCRFTFDLAVVEGADDGEGFTIEVGDRGPVLFSYEELLAGPELVPQ